jgi:DNA-binding SARP family transcriptional activator
MMTVNSLGKFQITDGSVVMGDEGLRSPMLSRLLVYLLLYRDKTLATDDLIAAIWQDEEISNPAGALKNLMYRLRKVLVSYFGEQEYVLSSRGSYRWNPAVEVNLDIEQFENLLTSAKQETFCERAALLYEQAVDIYQGDFMPRLTDLHWGFTLNTYYHSQYLTGVKELAGIYSKQERYEEIERLSTEALKHENGDEELYCCQIEALLHCGKIALAMESYEKAHRTMTQELGIHRTDGLNRVYEDLLAVSRGDSSYQISEIQKDIEEDEPAGVFLCGYPVFKKIYHLEVRRNARSGQPENLVLFTFEPKPEDTPEVAGFRIRQAMNGLEEVLLVCLRSGDVASRCSESQFILLLPTCTKELALLVANRIIAKLYEKNEKYKKVNIKINIEELSRAGKLVEQRERG